MNEQEIRNAYQALEACRKAYLEAASLVAELKDQLEQDIAAATIDGRIAGKNPEERKASTRMVLAAQHGLLIAAELHERQAKTDLEIAEDAVEMTGRLLRNEELAWRQTEDLLTQAQIIYSSRPDSSTAQTLQEWIERWNAEWKPKPKRDCDYLMD